MESKEILDNNTLGQKLSPILEEIQDVLLEYYEIKPNFTNEGFIAGIYIFQSILLDKMWELQSKENMSQETREDMATKCGTEIRDLVKKYCNIDTHELYK